jgi:two-component system, NtrC family, response regulator GlrR
MPEDEPRHAPDRHAETRAHGNDEAREVRRFRLTVLEGPARGATWESDGDRCSIGAGEGNALVLADPTVSRFHCEIIVADRRARVRDLASKNGTLLEGIQIVDAFLRPSCVLRLGASTVRFELADGTHPVPLSAKPSFGRMIGQSVAMRTAFGRLERAAASDATVLLDGETGTGKGEAAEAIHTQSRRASGPFVVLDCGAVPENLLESELFGHERGAFTGAMQRRIGVFEEAQAGTLFIDEIGELPASLQPKLLRVLETRAVRRVGGSGTQPVDVRIVAATNRDLRAEVNAGRFRADLYYRLAVLRITLPPLRERPDDLSALAAGLLERLGAAPDQRARLLARPDLRGALERSDWPGNVRELRNFLERCLVYDDVVPTEEETQARAEPEPAPSLLPRRPFSLAREEAIIAFERAYLADLMREHGTHRNAAAAAAGIGRVYLYKLLTRHRMR